MSDYRYVTYSQIEVILEKYYRKRNPIDIQHLYGILKDSASGHPAPVPGRDRTWGLMSDEEFMAAMSSIPLLLVEPVTDSDQDNAHKVKEDTVFGVKAEYYNMMVHRQYNFLKEIEHSHDYIEVYYVFTGSCRVNFRSGPVTLREGDFLIIAPNAHHTVESNRKENFIIDMSVRGSSFEGLFAKQLSYDSVLSSFFRKVIYDKADLRYILFHTNGDEAIKSALKNIAMETTLHDTYNEIVYTSLTNIIFSILLRRCYEDFETDQPLEANDFARVLKYISDHYDTVTLDELASRFNYSKPHVCNLIKTNTGRTLTALVNAQKLTKAENLLLTTDFSIEEITSMIGFSSADHFTRLFRKTYGITPGKFRKFRAQQAL